MIAIHYPIPIRDLITAVSNALAHRYSDQALCTQYAWWMLQAITKDSKSHLLAQSHISLSPVQHEQLATWIKQQVTDAAPLAYLLGTVPFASIEILVEPPILIPRQETEEWCLALIEQLKNANCSKFTLLDLCTGSGCIALAIAHAFPHATIYASDISLQAIALAQKNKAHNGITNVTFIHSDLFTALPSMRWDTIVSNPPYIAPDELPSLDPSVRQWEDTAALIAPDQGLGIVKQIVHNARAHLIENSIFAQHAIPQLWLEIGYQQGTQVKQILCDARFSNVRVTKDLHGNDRIVTGCLTNGPTK